MRWWPRTIRWQMLLSLVLIETFSIALFAFLLTDYLQHQGSGRAQSRLLSQASSLALDTRQPIVDHRDDLTAQAVKLQADFGSVVRTVSTGPAGKILFTSEEDVAKHPLTAEELAQIKRINSNAPHIFQFSGGRQEAVKPIVNGSTLLGYAWVESRYQWDEEQIAIVLRASVLFGGGWIFLSTFLAWLVARRFSRPLTLLHAGTRSLMSMPQGSGNFPLPV